VRAALRGDTLDIEIRGFVDTTMCLSGDQHLALSDITAARVVSWDEVRAGLGWRTAGAYWPGLIATGWYAVPGRKAARQFLAVYRDRANLLLVDTRVERPARVVVATPEAAALAADITARLEDAPSRGET
jgi:hypothetical protein